MSIWNRVATRRTLLVAALCMLGCPAPSYADRLDIVVNGPGTIVATITDAGDSETARIVCTTVGENEFGPFEPFSTALCEANYLRGRVVTLQARPIPIDRTLYSSGLSSFGTWSDDRCPPTPVCDLPIDSDRQTVVASFSPQKVTVYMSDSPEGPGRVTSIPPGMGCEAIINARRECVGVFPLFTTVQLIAEGAGARWFRPACDAVVGSTCSVFTNEWRTLDLLFPGGTLGGRGGGFDVRYTVAKDGSGSGTVRSGQLNCGNTCSKIVPWGTRDTLRAFPDDGSTFVRWRGACGDEPSCSLTVGPVTRVTAVFRRDSAGGAKPPRGGSSAPPPPGARPPFGFPPGPDRQFVAVFEGRVAVRGARPQRIIFALRVSARSSIRAVLETASSDRVTARSWQVERGRRVLRLAVPRGARRETTYVLRITARDGRGHVRRLNRRVRLPR